MKKQDDWESKAKKEKLRWILTVIVIVVIAGGFILNRYIYKFKESSITELFEIAVSDYSKESYSEGTIQYFSEDSNENKKITLSEENISDLLTESEKTTVQGIKRKELDALDIHNSYNIEFESDISDDIVLFLGRDENTQNIILEVLSTDKKLADKYLVLDDKMFNLIEELIKQAP